jgi:hypothetical protein
MANMKIRKYFLTVRETHFFDSASYITLTVNTFHLVLLYLYHYLLVQHTYFSSQCSINHADLEYWSFCTNCTVMLTVQHTFPWQCSRTLTVNSYHLALFAPLLLPVRHHLLDIFHKSGWPWLFIILHYLYHYFTSATHIFLGSVP